MSQILQLMFSDRHKMKPVITKSWWCLSLGFLLGLLSENMAEEFPRTDWNCWVLHNGHGTNDCLQNIQLSGWRNVTNVVWIQITWRARVNGSSAIVIMWIQSEKNRITIFLPAHYKDTSLLRFLMLDKFEFLSPVLWIWQLNKINWEFKKHSRNFSKWGILFIFYFLYHKLS